MDRYAAHLHIAGLIHGVPTLAVNGQSLACSVSHFVAFMPCFHGERVFERLISALHGPQKSFFTPHFLGDKWPVVDYIVRLVGLPGAPYFFVQVKSTQRGYTPSGRLQTRVTADEMKALAACPAPTYIAGVDETSESCFIVSASGERSGTMSTLPTAFPLDRSTRELLWREVADYWAQRAPHEFVSRFADQGGGSR